jgi:hypothetical protein
VRHDVRELGTEKHARDDFARLACSAQGLARRRCGCEAAPEQLAMRRWKRVVRAASHAARPQPLGSTGACRTRGGRPRRPMACPEAQMANKNSTDHSTSMMSPWPALQPPPSPAIFKKSWRPDSSLSRGARSHARAPEARASLHAPRLCELPFAR